MLSFNVAGRNRAGISTKGLKHNVSSLHPPPTSLGQKPLCGEAQEAVCLVSVGQAVAQFSRKRLGRNHTAVRVMASTSYNRLGQVKNGPR